MKKLEGWEFLLWILIVIQIVQGATLAIESYDWLRLSIVITILLVIMLILISIMKNQKKIMSKLDINEDE